MRIALIIFLSIVTIESAHARACPVDIACEPYHWNSIDNLEECKKRKAYCLGINQCWHDAGSETEARLYRENTITPGYVRCFLRNRK